MKILVVEDDKFIAEALADALFQQNCAVDIATNTQVALEQAQADDYDLILLNAIPGKLDCITLCQKLCFLKKNFPILLLGVHENSLNKIQGLDAEADDSAVKLFNLEKLLAIIQTLLQPENKYTYVTKKWAGLCLNPQRCEVSYNQKQLNLTPKEYEILNLFINNPQRVFNCSLILDKVWELGETPTEDTVRAHIKGLRHKLKLVGAPTDLIETVYGLGYRLKQENHNSCLKNKKQENK